MLKVYLQRAGWWFVDTGLSVSIAAVSTYLLMLFCDRTGMEAAWALIFVLLLIRFRYAR